MFRDMTPVGIWRDSIRLWCATATCQMEMTTYIWHTLMLAPPREARPQTHVATREDARPERPRRPELPWAKLSFVPGGTANSALRPAAPREAEPPRPPAPH